MLFITLITLIICKALLSERLSLNFSYRITSIILLLTAFLNYNTLLNFDIITGIGIYNGLFHITYITQIIEIFLLIIGSIILISWPFKTELITEISSTTPFALDEGEKVSSYADLGVNKKYPLLYSLSLENYFNQSLIQSSDLRQENNIKYSLCYFAGGNNFINYSLALNYSIIVLFCTLGASLLISCSDLVSMYLSIELQSFSLYVLSTLYKNSELSTSAGLKYFLLGGLSSCLILFGAGLIYAYTGLTNFESIYSFISIYSIEINNNISPLFFSSLVQGGEAYSSSILLGFIFIFVGFLFKIAAAPFHNWSPDVYDDTPTIVTIWLTLIPKISILVLLLELHIHIDLIDQLSLIFNPLDGGLKLFSFNIDQITKNLLLVSSLFSLIIGSVVGLAQNRIKRLLAYSTISHIGYILLALGIYTEQSIDSFIFYIIQYIITNLNIFLILIGLSYIINQSINNDKTYFKDIRYISEFKGLFYSNPLISLSFSICLFSIAGIPPLIGFFSKQFVLYSAIQSGYNFISIVAIIVSVISASYYLKIIKTFFIDFDSLNAVQASSPLSGSSLLVQDSAELSQGYGFAEKEKVVKINNTNSFLISTLTLSILFFIFKPSLILNITQLLSLSLFYI
jgi:NADH-ubiquinone oxidoreductase chain 2